MKFAHTHSFSHIRISSAHVMFCSKTAWVEVENRLLLHVFYDVSFVVYFQFSSFEMKLSAESAIGMCVQRVCWLPCRSIANHSFSLIFHSFLVFAVCGVFFFCFCLPQCMYGTGELVIHYIFVTLQLHALHITKGMISTKK